MYEIVTGEAKILIKHLIQHHLGITGFVDASTDVEYVFTGYKVRSADLARLERVDEVLGNRVDEQIVFVIAPVQLDCLLNPIAHLFIVPLDFLAEAELALFLHGIFSSLLFGRALGLRI